MLRICDASKSFSQTFNRCNSSDIINLYTEPNTTTILDSIVTNLSESGELSLSYSSISALSTRSNSSSSLNKYNNEKKLVKIKKNKLKCLSKIETTRELIKFVVKKNSDDFNRSLKHEILDLPIQYECGQVPFEKFDDELFDEKESMFYDIYFKNFDSYSFQIQKYLLSIETLPLSSKRCKKPNKKLKLKKLLENQNVLSLLKNEKKMVHISFAKNSLVKSNKCVCVKFNIYEKMSLLLANYVNKTERAKFLYSNKSINKRHKLDPTTIAENKVFHRQIQLADCKKIKKNNQSNSNQMGDSVMVVSNALARGQINNELNQTYDDMYLEFLISIQHREITPEDYEYLSRLDELIKKKTVSDNILKDMKSSIVDLRLIEKLAEKNNELCGICLDNYVVGQIVKYLPCGHLFHDECIDIWLREQSTDCPLDKISVLKEDPNEKKITIEDNEIFDILNEILEKVVFEFDEIKQLEDT